MICDMAIISKWTCLGCGANVASLTSPCDCPQDGAAYAMTRAKGPSMLTLDEAVQMFEERFTKIEQIDVRADDLVCVVSGGVKPEGQIYPAWCTSPEAAVALWFVAANSHGTLLQADYRTLVWRMRPQLESRVYYHVAGPDVDEARLVETRMYTVYSRFALRP